MNLSEVKQLIKNYLDANANVGAAQIDNMTWVTIGNALDINLSEVQGRSNIALDKIKLRAKRYLKERDAKLFRDGVRSQLTGNGRVWLANNFPDADWGWGKDPNGDICLKLYPFGITPPEAIE